MALLSAMLDPSFQSHRIAELQLKFESLLSASLLDDEFAEDNPSLDQFRKSYLLAFYEFHQFPGHRSWLRISRVTRMAYHVGLDRLDFIASQSTEWAAVSDDDMREWRRLWWCLYRLDTYSNLASGAPYLINDDLMNTSFNQDPTADNPQKILLPTTCEQLSNVLPAIIADAHTSTENIHNITVSVLRQAGAATRLHLVQLPDGIASRVASVERQLAILHLSLPTGWLNPRRRAFSNESPEEHHGRIITVFHIRMAHLLLAIVACGHRQAGDWMTNWQRVLEACQDIATLASQWDSAFCNIVDPAITFTTFTALVFLDMHQKFDITMDYDLLNSIHHGITIMHLQLKHFGSLWTQAKLLACKCPCAE
ncbi:Transcription factor [Cordyceps fumosorosea ARSEF 2679]|uniref:Transcription factor n=1 Tax=Cordyceps fumosorosea (strain ARSEF 2679) TaxID=1081104 RepID=A0A167KSU5_CORFA|nr:Transcription factor [Cordyceps fumosorosea ARSEF 2679]OAA52144.1 Transcription factor [Cordyceps fumosorosea ARSEF 2679]